jgi:hypothetical protein
MRAMTIEFEENGSIRIPGVGAVIGSEFANVSVRFDTTGNAARVRLEDLRTGRVRYLDALELEAIIWLSEQRLTTLLDPSDNRWRDEDAQSDSTPGGSA